MQGIRKAFSIVGTRLQKEPAYKKDNKAVNLEKNAHQNSI
jgi:hypothetical protein